MFKTLRDKITLSGTIVLIVGVALLVFTFLSAYGFLNNDLSIVTSSDLTRTFGDALAPLIATSIHVMYLGVMGWVGSILTIRGVTILSQARQTGVVPEELASKTTEEKEQVKAKKEESKKVEKPEPEAKKPEAKPEQPKPKETKPYEPQIVILNPETVSPTQQKPLQTQEQKKENQ